MGVRGPDEGTACAETLWKEPEAGRRGGSRGCGEYVQQAGRGRVFRLGGPSRVCVCVYEGIGIYKREILKHWDIYSSHFMSNRYWQYFIKLNFLVSH